jgi:iron-sulfur cluster repair protein YtfE (RIC family)
MTQAVQQRPDTQEMVVVHRVFRREFRLAPQMVRLVPAGDAARAAVVAGHLTEMATMLHHHHSGEDELVWPLLTERASVSGEVVERMEAQHEAVAALLDTCAELVPAWGAGADVPTRDRLAGVLEELSAALDEHLAEEEREILPLCAEHMTAEEWGRLGQRGMAAMPKSRLLVIFGHLLEEASPQERATMLGHLPAPARLLFRAVGRRAWAKEVGRLRAGIEVPTQRTG